MLNIKNCQCFTRILALCAGFLILPCVSRAAAAPPVATPIFSIAGGTYNRAQTVTIASATNGASIAYTTDGSIPTESGGTITHGILYSTPLTISATTALSAIAFETGFTDSAVSIDGYTLQVATLPSDPSPDLLASMQSMSMTPTENVLVNFTGANGNEPAAALVQGSDGNFYGATFIGGSSSDGTIFKVTPAGVLSTLVTFTGTNPSQPLSLVQGSDGNFYGTTLFGGSSSDGTVFKMTPAGALTTLVTFTGTNGASPTYLVQGSDGNFYGTTYSGGSSSDGTVFKMTPAGVLTTLVTFTGANGANSSAGLVQGSDGNFYGTTNIGGSANDGTVFKMTPAGVLTTLVTFTGANGDDPGHVPLVQGNDGNFYGETDIGGSANDGTVFKITPAGVLTTLVTFTGANGANPSGLVQGSDGNFYGNAGGGSAGDGLIFQLIVSSQVAAPTFSPAAGTYTSAQTVTITSTTSGASFYYTTDGSTPSEFNGTLYSGPVSINSTMTLSAIAHESGFSDSPVTSGTYTINLSSTPTPTPTPAASGSGGGGAPSYWFYLALAVLTAARYAQTRKRGCRAGRYQVSGNE